MKNKYTLLLIILIGSMTTQAQNWIWAPQVSSVTEQLRDVYFVDNLTGWVVGDNGTILNTMNGGQAWIVQSSGTTHNLTGVYFIDATNGYAVGGFLNTGNVALKTTDGGNTWSSFTVGNTALSYNDVEFSSLNHGIIITRDSVYTTSNAGVTWVNEGYVTTVTGGLGNESVSTFNDSVSIIGGTRNKSSGTGTQPEIFDRRLWNTPLIWGTCVNNFEATDRIGVVEVAGPNLAFSAGERGKIYRMNRTGPNYNGPWAVNLDLSPDNSLRIIRSISFPTDKLGMFNTSADTNGNSYAIIYHTIDEGNTWTSTPDSIQGLLQGVLQAPTPNDAWIVGSGGMIYHGVPNTVGINETHFQTVKIYPNPVKDILWLDTKTANSIEILDIYGRLILEFNTGKEYIDLSYLKAGPYLLRTQSRKRVAVTRFIKQ